MLPCLTVKQPWAWAIAHAGKNVENRTWMPRSFVGCDLAIHAGAGWDRWANDDPRILTAAYPNAWDTGVPRLQSKDERFVRGAVIAVAVLDSICKCDGSCSPWAVYGQFHWRLVEVRTLATPVPARGALGVWPLLLEAETVVREQVPVAQKSAAITHENASSRKLSTEKATPR
jgi:hypothetical protein